MDMDEGWGMGGVCAKCEVGITVKTGSTENTEML